MRSELNNPTERIGRLLDEWDELEAHAQHLTSIIAKLSQEEFLALPPMPSNIEHRLEQQRRQFTLSKANDAKHRMRRRRMLGERGRERGHQDMEQLNEADLIAEISKDFQP